MFLSGKQQGCHFCSTGTLPSCSESLCFISHPAGGEDNPCDFSYIYFPWKLLPGLLSPVQWVTIFVTSQISATPSWFHLKSKQWKKRKIERKTRNTAQTSNKALNVPGIPAASLLFFLCREMDHSLQCSSGYVPDLFRFVVSEFLPLLCI